MITSPELWWLREDEEEEQDKTESDSAPAIDFFTEQRNLDEENNWLLQDQGTATLPVLATILFRYLL